MTRQVLEVVLVLAISVSAIVALATLHDPTASVAPSVDATGVSDVDARWTPKWGAAAEFQTKDQGSIVDTRWPAKTARAEVPGARGR